jgi:hypothetical protein
MAKYEITDEARHYVDAILYTFTFPQKVNNIRGAIAEIVRYENGDISDENITRLYLLVKNFLWKYEFGHGEDYVFIIDKKGMDLKDSGSLSNFEKTLN